MKLIVRGQDTRRKDARESCFILMPYKPDLDELYARVIKPSVERTGVFQCLRADEIYGPRPIMQDIWQSIRQSKLVIADLTGRNPNVLYELGLAHAIQKPVILLTQNIDDVPFDLKHVRVIIYRNTDLGRKQLFDELYNALRIVAKDIKRPISAQQYVILGAHEEPEILVKKGIESLVSLLKSKDTNDILKAMLRITDMFQHNERSRQCDPRILAAVLPHVQSPYVEIQLATIRAIKSAGDQVHAPSLHGFLSSKNPVLVEAAVMALGELSDHSAVPLLLNIFDNPDYQMCRDEILRVLGILGGETAISFLGRVAIDNQAPLSERKIAVRALGESDEYAAIDVLLSLDIDVLDSSLRCELAEAFASIEPPYSQVKLKRLETCLKKLASDKSPDVRGGALASWCIHSVKLFYGKLDRSYLWHQLLEESDDVLDQFFSTLSLCETPFAPEESSRLVELGEKNPTIMNGIVFYLKDIGDSSASDFMIRAYNESEENQLWVLVYLSRIPSKDAAQLLCKVIQQSNDSSEVVLAAIALSRLQVESVIDLILEKVFDSYEWVQVIAKGYLEECLQKEKSIKRQKKLRQVLKKLPKEEIYS